MHRYVCQESDVYQCSVSADVCEAGYTSATGLPLCSACPHGTFAADEFSCTPCPADKKTLRNARTRVEDCVAKCAPGEYVTVSGCSRCPSGFYSSGYDSAQCVECAASDAYTIGLATSESDCRTTSHRER